MFLRLYRVLPKPLRKLLSGLFTKSQRDRIVRFLVRGGLIGGVRRRVNRLVVEWRHARLLRAGRHQIVTDHGVLAVARTEPNLTPRSVRHSNEQMVTELLDRLAVPYFAVKGTSSTKSAIGVHARHKDTIREVLGGTWSGSGTYVRKASPRSGRTAIGSAGWAEVVRDSTVVEVFETACDPGGTLVLGVDCACGIEFWQEDDEDTDWLKAPRDNVVSQRIGSRQPAVTAPRRRFTPMVEASDASVIRTAPEFAVSHIDDITFPIDVVYTWVDGSDSHWQARKAEALGEVGTQRDVNEFAANPSRFVNRDELRYSLRSLHMYAPWIRHIYVITDSQLPPWLDPSHPDITLVDHHTLFGDTGKLPTFNSHAIESRIHRVPGLAEHFVYFNDDMFLGRPASPRNFFHSNGMTRFFLSRTHVEAGVAQDDDLPVLAAGKNNRELIESVWGTTLTQKIKHVPYSQRISVLSDLERHFPDEFAATAQHQFRHPGDVSIPASLAHYWAYLTGRGMPARIRYTYADLAAPGTPLKLGKLLRRRDFDTFCLNDHDADDLTLEKQTEMLTNFLPKYFPTRSPIELSPEAEAQRTGRSPSELWRSEYGTAAFVVDD